MFVRVIDFVWNHLRLGINTYVVAVLVYSKNKRVKVMAYSFARNSRKGSIPDGPS